MRLPKEVLDYRLDVMPQGEVHEIVWHLCSPERHVECYAIGALAVVSFEPPEVPDEGGGILMRLHPFKRDLCTNPDGITTIDIRRATSLRHSTVWSRTEQAL